MSAPVQLFGLGLQGKSPNVTSRSSASTCMRRLHTGRTKSRVAYFGTPGTVAFSTLGVKALRGMHVPKVSDYIYAIVEDRFYRVDATGATVQKGTLSTVGGHVAMESDGVRILMVDGVGGYYNMQTDAFTPASSPNFPNGAQTVSFSCGAHDLRDQSVTGQFRWSDQYSDTWPTLNFARAEASLTDWPGRS